MHYLHDLLNSTETPFLYTLILGLLTAISPCQLARNITAIGYISRDIQNPGKVFVNGLFYTLGNAAGYLLIGLILFLGASKFSVSKALISSGNLLMGLILVLGGILMLDIISIRFPEGGRLLKEIEKRRFRGNKTDSALLGLILSLSFCPYNAALFFGMLIPMTIASPSGLYLPLVYSIATGLPVAIFAFLLAFSVSGIGSFYKKISVFQIWFNRVISIIFIGTGLYFLYLFLVQHYNISDEKQNNYIKRREFDYRFPYETNNKKLTLLFTKFKPIDNLEYQIIYKYSGSVDKGNNYEITKQNPTGKLIMRVENLFENKDSRTHKKIYDENNKLMYYSEYSNDKKAEKIGTILKKSSDDIVLTSTVYSYNTDGFAESVKTFDESGILTAFLTYRYNKF